MNRRNTGVCVWPMALRCHGTVGILLVITALLFPHPAAAQSPTINFGFVAAFQADFFVREDSIAVDPSGNVYTAGHYEGATDFDPGPGEIIPPTSPGEKSIFLSKLTPNGDYAALYTFADGNQHVGPRACSIATDADGNVYMTGPFSTTLDFDPGPGIVNRSPLGLIDIFMLKLSPDGDLIWVHTIGSSLADNTVSAIAVDAAQNVYITGYYRGSPDFDPGPDVFELPYSNNPDSDGFILKLTGAGEFIWAVAFDGFVRAEAITVDSQGNVLTAGWFIGSADFDPGPGTSIRHDKGDSDIFISKLSANGEFVFANTMGGTSDEWAADIAVESNDDVYICGSYLSTSIDFNAGPSVNIFDNPNSRYTGFVHKVDRNGGYGWTRVLASLVSEPISGPGSSAMGLAVDSVDNVVMYGGFQGPIDFHPGLFAEIIHDAQTGGLFVWELDRFGRYVWSRHIAETSGGAIPTAMTVDDVDNLYIGGYIVTTLTSIDFDPGPGDATIMATESMAAFVHKFFVSENEAVLDFVPPPGVPLDWVGVFAAMLALFTLRTIALRSIRGR